MTRGLRYLSVCSGIEAASVAWHPLGWEAAGFSEIERFPSAVLAHHYPDVRNFGDFTTISEDDVGSIDLLVGGTPCQSFSVAGLRGGLDDDRGNLALEFCRLALRTRPRWLVWENVPGVLSSNGGRDFGSILGALAECGYGFAHTILDAQYFGLAQRRKRVFVVGYLGDWRPAAAVLFERESLRGDPPPRRGQGHRVAALTSTGVGTCGADDNQAQAGHLIATTQFGDIASSLTARHDSSPCADRGMNIAPVVFKENMSTPAFGMGISQTFEASNYQAVAFQPGNLARGQGSAPNEDVFPTLKADHGDQMPHVAGGDMAVRRLTPRECCRLQGFPDDYLDITYRGKPAVDGPKYKALGNSFAVPVVRWIGRRIAMVDRVLVAA